MLQYFQIIAGVEVQIEMINIEFSAEENGQFLERFSALIEKKFVRIYEPEHFFFFYRNNRSRSENKSRPPKSFHNIGEVSFKVVRAQVFLEQLVVYLPRDAKMPCVVHTMQIRTHHSIPRYWKTYGRCSDTRWMQKMCMKHT